MPAGYDFEGPPIGGGDAIANLLESQPAANQNDRLRDAFAALLAQGPVNGVMPPDQFRNMPPTPGQYATNPNMSAGFPTLQTPPQDPNLNFPSLKLPEPSLAPLSEQNPNRQPPPLDPASTFPGAQSVRIMPPTPKGAYALPRGR